MAEETPMEKLETFTSMTSGASGVQYLIDNPTAFEDMLDVMEQVIDEFPEPEYKEKSKELLNSVKSMSGTVSDLTQKADAALQEQRDLEESEE